MRTQKNFLAWSLMTSGIAFLAIAAAVMMSGLGSTAASASNAIADAEVHLVAAPQQAAQQTSQQEAVLLPEMPVAKVAANANGVVADAPIPANTQPNTQLSTIISPEVPSLIEIPAIKVKAPIVSVGPGKKVGKNSVEWSSPNKGQVGWHNYSGRLGEAKNIVMNGHNNIQGAVFRKLYTLQAGDLITVSSASYVRMYQVQEVLTLLERGVSYEQRVQNAKYIQPKNEDILTLVSCWPETNNTHRVIVIAKPVSQNY
jgi:LPXTG-site transpeptidase (sortase) family protein